MPRIASPPIESTRTTAVGALAWPLERLPELLAAAARRAGAPIEGADDASPPAPAAADAGAWIEWAARRLGVEAEPVAVPYPELDGFLRGGAPALMRIGPADDPSFLLSIGGGRRHVRLLGPDLTEHRVPTADVRAALAGAMEAPAAAQADALLDAAGLGGRRARRSKAALLGRMLAARRVGGCWLLRAPATARVATQLGRGRLIARLAALVALHAAQYALWVGSWWLLGWMALGGRLTREWLIPWMLLVGTVIAVRLLSTLTAGGLAIDAGARLKRRLLAGALRMDADETRHLGVGRLLGRTLDAEAVESLALSGGFLAITTVVELAVAAWVLSRGAAPGWHLAAIVLCTLLFAAAGLAYHRARAGWTRRRLDLTGALVEEMEGNRTRLAQEPRPLWHRRADAALQHYLEGSRGLDRLAVLLQAALPRIWLLLGLAALGPVVVAGGATPAALGVSLGGVLLAWRAFAAWGPAAESLSSAAIAWGNVAAFAAAAEASEPHGDARLAPRARPGEHPEVGRPLLDVLGMSFRHDGRAEPVLRPLSFRIRTHDRILLEGPSGGGKSTLARLLCAARSPSAGLLLLEGLDLASVGAAAWRRRVVLVPQFHENHVLMGTLAFNLLLGRRWPPSDEDLSEAEAVCRALGLGPLLDRMPSGLMQIVGETGWQLSHGERSRVFLARALLQSPDLTILDESFGALDPETLRHSLRYTLERPGALLVIAHP